MPVFLLYAAGCALVGGGIRVLDEANQRRARESMQRRQQFEADVLRGELSLEELRRQAREAGIDPEKAVAGYDALRRGEITFDDVKAILAAMA